MLVRHLSMWLRGRAATAEGLMKAGVNAQAVASNYRLSVFPLTVYLGVDADL